MTLDELVKTMPKGFKFNVGMTPYWSQRESLPKHLKKRPYEAYVCSGTIGTPTWIFESADGINPEQALEEALTLALNKTRK